MNWFKTISPNNNLLNQKISRFTKFRSSIHGMVVIVLLISLLTLFIAYVIICRSVNGGYMKSVIRENGNNIGYLVEGALYRSMLENDQKSLQYTLDIINTLTGIDDVNMYDAENNLAYSSIKDDTLKHSNPDCKSCHADVATMFSDTEKSYRIIDIDSECSMSHDENDTRYLLIKSPILNSPSCYVSSCHAHSETDKVLGSLIIKMPLTGLDNALQRSRTNFLIFTSVLTVFLMFFTILITNRKIAIPLNAIINASIAVAKGDKSTRLEIKPNQLLDMKMVSLAFNEMLDNLQKANTELQNWSQQLEYKVQKKSEELGQAQNELINIERIASLGKLSLSVAHEINNPLSGILVYTKLIYKQLNNQSIESDKKESMLKHLKFIESETKRCGDIVKSLLDFSRKEQDGFEPKHLNEILIDTYELMAHPMKIANVNFLSDFSARNDLILCSPNQIKQACVAMLINASEAVSENGEVLIKTMNPDNEHVRIEITDNGIGIAEEDISHIFQPFFSTKENASGIGLGLAIVHGIVQSHKGKIDVKSTRGKETTFSITLPLVKN